LGILDFDVIEEHWNEYDSDKGCKLRGPVVLTRVARPGHGAVAGQYELAFSQIFTITAPPEQMGRLGLPLRPEEIIAAKPGDVAEDPKIPVRTITCSEPCDIYRVEKTMNMFQVKLVVMPAYRVKDRFDQFAEPSYVLTHGTVVTPVGKGYVK
jgi:hypothetical protein